MIALRFAAPVSRQKPTGTAALFDISPAPARSDELANVNPTIKG